MDKQTMVHVCNEIAFTNKTERATDTHKNLDD